MTMAEQFPELTSFGTLVGNCDVGNDFMTLMFEVRRGSFRKTKQIRIDKSCSPLCQAGSIVHIQSFGFSIIKWKDVVFGSFCEEQFDKFFQFFRIFFCQIICL